MQENIRMPKQKRAIEKKESLINAAFELFNKKGFYNTNSKEIAKKAGVSTGLFYNYFNDKSDIYLEILNRISEKKYLKLESFLERLLKEDDKKQELKNFFVENTKLLAELAFIYKDIETIKIEYKQIGDFYDNNKQLAKQLIMNLLSNINDKQNLKEIEVKSDILIATIDANNVLISKKENIDDKIKYIDEIVSLIYSYMF